MLKSILITVLFLFFAISCPATTFALPVHYTASGSAEDNYGNILSISGWVDIDDQFRHYNSGRGELVDRQWLDYYVAIGDRCILLFEYSIPGFSLQFGEYALSGDRGEFFYSREWNYGLPVMDLCWEFNLHGSGSGDFPMGLIGMSANYSFINNDYTLNSPLMFDHLTKFIEISDMARAGYASPLDPYAPIYIWLTRDDIAPVPEPSTILLLGVGLVGLAAYGRKKNKK